MSVLSIVAIMAVVGAGFFMQQTMAIKRTQNHLNYMQAYQFALGAEELAKQVLWADWEVVEKSKDKKHFDALADKWNDTIVLPLPEFGLKSGIKVQVRDLHRKFNINNVFNEATGKLRPYNEVEWQQLEELFIAENFEDKFEYVLGDWLDDNTEPTDESWEDDGYMDLTPSYRAANHPLQELSELRLLKEMKITQYRELIKKLTVLPATETKININTASSEVIARHFVDLDSGQFEEFLQEERGKKGFETMADFIDAFTATFTDETKHAIWTAPRRPGTSQSNNTPQIKDYFDVQSEYFEVRTKAIFDERICYLISRLYRDPSDGKVYLIGRTRAKSIEFEKEEEEDDSE